MNDEEWATVSLVLDKAWKGDFGPGEERAYRLMLDNYGGEQVVLGLRKIAATGHHAIPSVSEIVQAIERDDTRPVFVEMYSAIFDAHPMCGGRGVLWTRAHDSQPEAQARLDRAYDIHPLIGAFVQSYGLDRLAMLEVDHDEKAGLIRRDLQIAWESFVQANAHRDAAALAAGRRRELTRRAPRKLDPATALGLDQPGDTGDPAPQQQEDR